MLICEMIWERCADMGDDMGWRVRCADKLQVYILHTHNADELTFTVYRREILDLPLPDAAQSAGRRAGS